MENNENGAKTDARNALKNRGVFTRKKEHFGIPAQMFFAGIALSVGIAVTVAWWGGLLFGDNYPVRSRDNYRGRLSATPDKLLLETQRRSTCLVNTSLKDRKFSICNLVNLV